MGEIGNHFSDLQVEKAKYIALKKEKRKKGERERKKEMACVL
jgi:hypothetical protein